jgi:hypothetical protein
MDERIFLQSIHRTSQSLGINSLLLLSGIEGLYTFRDVELNKINYQFLDSLILTIFALRIGDHFHNLAEENLESTNETVRHAAHSELKPLTHEEIGHSANVYLQSFAQLLGGKSVIRKYHEKALEAAALEIEKTQDHFRQNSIGTIVLHICQHHLQDTVNLASVFKAGT